MKREILEDDGEIILTIKKERQRDGRIWYVVLDEQGKVVRRAPTLKLLLPRLGNNLDETML